jgi:hypothetical protein
VSVATGVAELERQLRDAGETVIEVSADFVIIEFVVPGGAHQGDHVKIGLQGPDFPASPPPGPHVQPRMGHPDGNVTDSALGADWEYWSRPFVDWRDSYTAEDYMAHIRKLFLRFQ